MLLSVSVGNLVFLRLIIAHRAPFVNRSRSLNFSQIFLKTFQKGVDKSDLMCYNMQVVRTWPVGQAVKTLASHAGNMGSIPVRVTKRNKSELFRKSKLVRICFLLLIVRIDTEHHRRERPTVTLGGGLHLSALSYLLYF